MSRRAAIIVLDGLGIGPAADTDAYGDSGSNTLGNVARAVRPGAASSRTSEAKCGFIGLSRSAGVPAGRAPSAFRS